MQLLENLGLLWLSVQAVSPIAAHASHGHHGLQHAHLHQAHQMIPRDITSFNLLSSTVLTNGTLSGTRPALPPGKPQPPPPYMKDNVNNFYGTAPDRGRQKGPVLGSLNATTHGLMEASDNTDDYWLSSMGSAGVMPLAPSNYQLFRNVKDFGAVGDGVTDDTAAINRAAATYGLDDLTSLRCGEDCGSTSILGAVVYFPPGTYLISTPIIQYYYTQFVGNPTDKPTILGSENFTGIALFDTDFYIPGGDGSEWYINQSNFYRQIRNFIFDMTSMNWTNTDNDQTYVPAGIHWQVGQATSITNCDFKMSVSSGTQSATAVGIFMENGSGGMVSDLTFTGGNIGFLAGSQQFTAINLQFTSCLTAIKSIWNWGFTWKNIYVLSCYIAIDATEFSGVDDQGTGSIAVIDSHFNGVPYAITVAKEDNEQPNIILDNLLVEDSTSVVLVSGGDTILEGSSGALYYNSWANGYEYLPDGSGGILAGFMDPAPDKPESLLDSSGAYFRQAKPQYADETPIVATENGVSNDMSGDQASAINTLLADNVGSVIFFPAGIYLVEDTIKVPVGSRIIGSAWSQIMGTGSAFQDEKNPKVVVQVGEAGDQGTIEITDMLFTVQGPTAGAILMEWNVHESTQGSAAMWDSHFRVGGANGTNLGLDECPAGSGVNTDCMAASLMLHITSTASAYLENVWAWVADHDLDSPLNAASSESDAGVPLNVETDISVYGGRGILIESQGPSWLYGTASEHSQLYQYELLNASTIYLGHMQTETPYYQPSPNALSPYTIGLFSGDPTFSDCSDDLCRGAWALRVLNSTDIFIYSAGFYSWFKDYDESCVDDATCQLALVDTNYANGLWLYNLFTKGGVQVVSPEGGLEPLYFNSTTQDGYTSEIAAWLALAQGGEDIGTTSNTSGSVYIDPSIWNESSPVNVSCWEPCEYILPPIVLPTNTTFIYPSLVTPVVIGEPVPTWYVYNGNTTTTTEYVTSTTTITVIVPAVTTSTVSQWNVAIGSNTTSTVITASPSVIAPAFNVTYPPFVWNGTTFPPAVYPFYPPPWPGTTIPTPTVATTSPDVVTWVSGGATWVTTLPASTTSSTTDTGSKTTGGGSDDDQHHHHITHHRGAPHPTCLNSKLCGHKCNEGLLGLIFNVCDPCWTGCGGSSSPNDEPNNPNGDPDNSSSSSSSECETATYSSCSTACITASPSDSCTSTCREVVGCDTTGTSNSFTWTPAPLFTGTPDSWSDYSVSGSALSESEWLAAGAIYSEFTTITGVDTPTTTATGTGTAATGGASGGSGSSGSGSSGTGSSGDSTGASTSTHTVTVAPTPTSTVTEVIVVSTVTKVATSSYPALAGAAVIAAEQRLEIRNIEVRDYDLNFVGTSTTVDVCSAGWAYNYGAASPTPTAWSAIPKYVSFFSVLTVHSSKYSDCVYTNSAAPSDGDGGTLSCNNDFTLPCAIETGPVLGCNEDILAGYDTSIKVLVNCPISTMTTTYSTYSSRVTVTTEIEK